MSTANSIALEILNYSYLEHFKLAKDLSFIFPIDHPKRLLLQEEIENIQNKISLINNDTASIHPASINKNSE